jgi:hypothetical protein
LAWTRDVQFVETFSTLSKGASMGVGKARPDTPELVEIVEV